LTSELDPDRIDCHIHAGLERRESLEFAFGILKHDHREIVGLLDHAELYMESPPTWADIALIESAQRLDEPSLVDLFRKRLRGPGVFYRQVRDAISAYGAGMKCAVALEINGANLDGLDPGWLDGADYLGICTTQPSGETPWGEHMAKLIASADKLRGARDMTIVLHHPFRWRLLELAASSLVDPPLAAGFTPEDARVTARALSDAGAVAEVNYASYYHLKRFPSLVVAARDAFQVLKNAGAKFSLGSDAHWLSSTNFEYEPRTALSEFGVDVEDLRLPDAFS